MGSIDRYYHNRTGTLLVRGKTAEWKKMKVRTRHKNAIAASDVTRREIQGLLVMPQMATIRSRSGG